MIGELEALAAELDARASVGDRRRVTRLRRLKCGALKVAITQWRPEFKLVLEWTVPADEPGPREGWLRGFHAEMNWRG